MTAETPPAHEPTPAEGAGPPAAPHLQRRRSRGVVAGVASGIAERFDVNENLVRAVFIALAFLWGLGVALYLVLWAVLPSAAGDDADGSRRERPPRSTTRRLAFAVGAALVVLAVLALAVAKPFRLLAPGVAVAWVVFLAGLSVVALRTPARRLTWRRLFALVFLVVTTVIVVVTGAAMGFLASTGVPLAGGNGDHVWQPTSLAGVHHAYRGEFGVGTLDLSAVEFPKSGFHVSASIAAGMLRIVVPADAVVDLTTTVGAGTIFDVAGWVNGVATAPYSGLPPGVKTGEFTGRPVLHIDARVGVGQIDLMRARPARL